MSDRKPRLLDLFCGAGGSAMGYHRAGFDVVGIDINPQPHYPFTFIRADALNPPVDLAAFDLIHASPPCQAYSTLGRNSRWGTEPSSPPLIAETRRVLALSGVQYVIENVVGARAHLREPLLKLRGPDFGLTSIDRTRLFELGGWMMLNEPTRRPTGALVLGVYGARPDGRRLSAGRTKEQLRAPQSVEEASTVMGIDWMSWDELREAIPPAYTEYIGLAFLDQHIGSRHERKRSLS